MGTIQWKDSYSVDHPEIDAQHREWISIYNKLHSTLLNGTSDEVCAASHKTLKEMMDYAEYHFRLEKEYMESIGYPDIVKHCRLHKDFDNLIYQHNRKVEEGSQLVVNATVLGVIKEWLLTHILNEDKKYSDFARSVK